MKRLINILLPIWLLCVVDIVEDNLAVIEVPQGRGFTYIHAETENMGCTPKEGGHVYVRYEGNGKIAVRCQKVLDNPINL